VNITRTTDTRQDFNSSNGAETLTARIFEGKAVVTISSPDHGGAHVEMPAALLPTLAAFVAGVCDAAVPPIEPPATPAPTPTPEPEPKPKADTEGDVL
jgi:hypothetical protein